MKQEIVWRVAGLFALADQLEQRLAQVRRHPRRQTVTFLLPLCSAESRRLPTWKIA
jgi:hypothetical protein